MEINKISNRNIVFTFSYDFDQNIHLILGTRYNYIIDTGLGHKCMEPIQEYLGTERKPMIIINTHHHWDHIWGNSSFQNPIIISHRLCRDLINDKWDEMLDRYGKYCDGIVEKCLPTLVFENELYFPEDKVRLFYTPGHTIDSISVLDEEEKVINVGDNIGDSIEEILPSIYSKKEVFKDTILRYKELDAKTWISGHNVVFGKEVLDKIIYEL
ncbi:MBL fold metallo-hydrolase [Paenibacillus glacialis]|uniref:Zn-dependent hydrolase n=1 Tax=Paenibacillus glacialis TaxID=494026 RepID=A0A168KKQ2_9BACL|nr:MBL fold metallo-hydrolase [Paenibacillus glacialis]OAB42149.1 Zn-dependent hydrolase [Paenibacillus glacialis]